MNQTEKDNIILELTRKYWRKDLWVWLQIIESYPIGIEKITYIDLEDKYYYSDWNYHDEMSLYKIFWGLNFEIIWHELCITDIFKILIEKGYIYSTISFNKDWEYIIYILDNDDDDWLCFKLNILSPFVKEQSNNFILFLKEVLLWK